MGCASPRGDDEKCSVHLKSLGNALAPRPHGCALAQLNNAVGMQQVNDQVYWFALRGLQLPRLLIFQRLASQPHYHNWPETLSKPR